MVNKCCVPQCRGNYDKRTKISTFRFPKNEDLRRKWILAIPREDFMPTKHSRVCLHHFADEDVLRDAATYDEKGELVTAKLQQLRIKDGAVPSIFPNCPKYLSKEVNHRTSPETKRKQKENLQLSAALNESLQTAALFEQEHIFKDWDGLNSCIKNLKVSSYWDLIKRDKCILFLHISTDPSPVIEKSIVIDSSLKLTIHVEKLPLVKVGKFILPFICNNICDIEDILTTLENMCTLSKSIENVMIESVYECLSKHVKMSEQPQNILLFILEQLKLFTRKKEFYRYSPDFLILYTLVYSISPHAYRFLRSSGYIILPHPNTLKQLCSQFNVNPKDDNNLTYLRNKIVHLTDKDKKVILMLDEIHLKPYLDYKGGDILGISCNTENAATTAFVFMIQSITSSYKDVVFILPVSKIDAEILHSYILKLIIDLESLSFLVFCISSDNNSINRKAVSFFDKPPNQTFVYKHPVNSERPLFFVRDTVHLLKCIRNNWINQRNSDQCIYFPEFESNPDMEEFTIKTAPFKVLKSVFDIEKNEIVKHCHTLTKKSVSPSNLERQNVKLVVQIFNMHVVKGLLHAGPKYDLQFFQETSDFINTILTWWDIMNVKTIYKGQHKRNIYQEPLKYENDKKLTFLYDFLDWLDSWKKCINLGIVSTGFLTNETHEALYQTTYAIIELVRYCQETLKADYILTGKFQTDSLENRFGKYRQLAGGQYHISLTQVLEIEKKLRIQSVLPMELKSKSFGNISIEINETPNDNEPLDLSLPPNHIVFLLKKFDFQITDDDYVKIMSVEDVLVYIAGYCIHSCFKRLKCKFCLINLTAPKDDTSSSLIDDLNRGGLKFPKECVVDVIATCYIIVTKLLSEKYEAEFLKAEQKRATVLAITVHFLNLYEKSFDFNDCEEGHNCIMLQKYVINACINTLLNNYCKNLNNSLKDTDAKKRKLKTLKESTVNNPTSSNKKSKLPVEKKPKTKVVKNNKSKQNKALNPCVKKRKTMQEKALNLSVKKHKKQ